MIGLFPTLVCAVANNEKKTTIYTHPKLVLAYMSSFHEASDELRCGPGTGVAKAACICCQLKK